MTRKLTSLVLAAAITAGGVAPTAAGAKATSPGKHKVNVETYVYKEAGKLFDGTVFKKDAFKVKRISKSGKWAYGFADRVGRNVWIKASALDKVR